MDAEARACTARRRDGQPCSVRALASSDEQRCFAHDPARQEALKASRVAGGKARSRTERAAKMLPARLAPILTKLITLFDDCYEGTVPIDRARACATLAGAIVKVLETGQLEERLTAVEAAVERRQA